MTPPSILVVDDGELARVPTLLDRLSVDFVRVEHPARGVLLDRPRDVLLTSGPRAMTMPPLRGEGTPLWVCIYDQDFRPLRERLRALGVHYLVSGDLPQRAFELFLRQIVYRGRERRRVRRIPLRCEVEVEQATRRWNASLVELCRTSCVFRMPDATSAALDVGRALVVRLPPGLMDDDRMDLAGRVVRTSGGKGTDGYGPLVVAAFRDLDPDAAARLDAIVTGHTLGTQVTPLAPEPGSPGPAVPSGPPTPNPTRAPEERRRAPRHRYERRVEAVTWHGSEGPRIALGRDLSISGLRLVASPPPSLGAEVTLALYGGAREEPVVVRARVVREGEIEAALRFQGLTASQQRALERLLGAVPRLEDLQGGGETVHVAEIA